MRDFALIFKVLMKNQYSRRVGSGGKLKLASSVITVLCAIPLVLLFCIVAGFVAYIVPDSATLSLISTLILTVVQILAIFISAFSVMNVLYSAPDVPFLNTLPVKQTSVFFAKFTVIYISTLTLTASLTLPTLLTMTIVYAAMGRALFYGSFALLFIAAVVSPILPLFIITLFSMPLSYIGTFFKGKSVLKTVLSLLFYVLIMVGYLLLIYFLSSNEDIVNDSVPTAQMLGGLVTFAKIAYPNKVLMDFVFGIEAGKNFGISFAIYAGMFIVMILLSTLFYKRINQRNLESGGSSSSHSSINYKKSGVVASLMKKDFLHIVRNPQMATSCLANILLCPIITAVMYFVSGMQSGQEGAPVYLDSMLKLSYIVLYTLIFLGGTNMMAMIAYTREGRSFYLSKSLPISARESITAKFILALIPSGIVLTIQVILAFALYRLDVLSVALFLICSALSIVGATALHIYCDMRFGNVNWNTRQDLKRVSQGNIGSMVVAFWLVFVGLIAMVGGMVLSAFMTQAGGLIVVLSVFWGVLFLLSAITFVVGILVLRFKAERYYDEIGERKMKERSSARLSTRGGNNMLIK